MKSRRLLDPDFAKTAEVPGIEFTHEALPALNAAMEVMFADLFGERDRSVSVSEYTAPVALGAPDVRLYVYTPPGKALRGAIFHIHGGGFVFCDVPMHTALNQQRARDHDCVVVSVEYRLASAAPYPAPIEDCYAGLKWTVDHAAELGIDPTRIVVLGESAGGGLAAALCLLARDKGGPAIAHQFLSYPMLDHRTGTAADVYANPYAGEFGWTRGNNSFGWRCMLGEIDPAGDVPATCSPARATNLAGLPPAFIAVGALDLFVDEDIDYAARLGRDGVPIELHVYPGAPHGFDLSPEALPLIMQAKEDRDRALRKALNTNRRTAA
jgi:acetyl esterase